MPMSATAYYAAHAQTLREHGAMNAARLWPRRRIGRPRPTIPGPRYPPPQRRLPGTWSR
ncbi:hypothetical protein [Streptomyces nojiriensis]|uniref:hypothetical protein n=1 Tax=Streptomyces nojiriensis TaxID=66374 RepID=UPI0036533440